MKSDVIHCKNCDIITLDGKVVETKPECYMKFFRGNSVTNELVENVLDLRKYVTNDFKDAQKDACDKIRKELRKLELNIDNNPTLISNEYKLELKRKSIYKNIYKILDKIEKEKAMSDYKFTPIIVEKDKNGKILIDEEKLKELLMEAYSNGYIDGQLSNSKEVSPITIPSQPYNPMPYYPDVVPTTPTVPSPFWYDKFYCVSGEI